MTKKKRKSFGISQQLKEGLKETFSIVENNRSGLRYEVIPLSRIEADPENPRELAISAADILNGISLTDPLRIEKEKDLDGLRRMGETIKKSGLINAIGVYKHGDKYRLIAGERRFLSCLVIGKADIQARVYVERPAESDLRIIQWVENNEREDLSLKERMSNIKAIVESVKSKLSKSKVTATFLKDILSVSAPQAGNYLAIISAPLDVKEAIDASRVNSIEKAAFLSKIKDGDMRTRLTAECEGGRSLRRMGKMLDLLEAAKREKRAGDSDKKRVGKPLGAVNLGGTKKTKVVEILVKCVLKQPDYQRYAQVFEGVVWSDFKASSSAFKKLVTLLETENDK